jgi:O-methyltransferase
MGLRTVLGLKKLSERRKRDDSESARRAAPHPEFDGIVVPGRHKQFLNEPRFVAAWENAVNGNAAGWPAGVPDIRWRAHICVRAAQQALMAQGDFVECGVHTGLLSMTVCHYLDFARLDRTFWLFDTFNGIPLEAISGRERDHAINHNRALYFDCFDIAQRNFLPWPNARLVRGALPTTLEVIADRPIAYLSIDLNSATYEMQVIERLWPQITPGGAIVLDDYGFDGYEAQYEAWNTFASRVGHPIFYLPTGQGLLVKHGG